MSEITIKAEPENSAYLDTMAWILFHQKKYKESLEYIQKALKAEGNIPDSVIADHAGDIYNALGMKQDALKYWNLSLSVYSEDSDYSKTREKISRAEQPSPPKQ